jgi:hypothetical protein
VSLLDLQKSHGISVFYDLASPGEGVHMASRGKRHIVICERKWLQGEFLFLLWQPGSE